MASYRLCNYPHTEVESYDLLSVLVCALGGIFQPFPGFYVLGRLRYQSIV